MSVNYKYLIEERDAAEKRAKELAEQVDAERKKSTEEIQRLEGLIKVEQDKLRALSVRHTSLPLKDSGAYQEQLDALLTWDDGISGSLTSFARELLSIQPNKGVLLAHAAGLASDCGYPKLDSEWIYKIEVLGFGDKTPALMECLRRIGSPSYAASIAIGIYPVLFGERIKRRGA